MQKDFQFLLHFLKKEKSSRKLSISRYFIKKKYYYI